MNITLEFDIVTVSDDMNDSITDIVKNYEQIPDYKPLPEELAEIKLYYVVISRCKHKLNNAIYLKEQ